MRRNLVTAMAQSISAGLKSIVPATTVPAYAVNQGSWWGSIREAHTGDWQRNITADPYHTLLGFSAVYACITLISDDISKLRIKLMALDPSGVWQETANPAYSPVLRKPNHYQTRIQFISQWVSSKLIHGNTYVLKERDSRGVVVALYVLDPRLVKALVATNGEVFYQVGDRERLTGSELNITVPASEIIHDRAICFFHPLIGVGPIYACGISATQGNRIQANSAKFFENMSRPSGQLTAPGTIDDETAERLKRDFESRFSGGNIGRLLVTGDGLKYEAMTIPAQQAQLIEQLKWTVEDVARCFHVPLHKIASDSGVKFNNMAAMNQDYYSQTLQNLIESIEVLLDEGLGMAGDSAVGVQKFGVELDLEGLLRMDPVQRMQRNEIAVRSGQWSPNEARATDNLSPVTGGGEPYLQQQNFPLSVLAKQPPPGSTQPPAPAPALPAPADPNAADAAKAISAMTLQVIEEFKRNVEAIDAQRQARDSEHSAAQIQAVRDAADGLRAQSEAQIERALVETANDAATAVQLTEARIREHLERVTSAAETAEMTRSERAQALHAEHVSMLKALADELRAERTDLQEQRATLDEEVAVRGFFDILTKGLEHD